MSKVFSAAMLSHYAYRTFKHIHLVQKRAVIIAEYYAICHDGDLFKSIDEMFYFLHDVAAHDQSKFSPEQWPIYCIMSYKRNVTGENLVDDEKKEFKKSFNDHCSKESHHPEMMDTPKRWYEFDKISVIHCACDLQAMADEFGEGSARKYFNDTWFPKHNRLIVEKSFYTDILDVKFLMEKCFTIWENIDSERGDNEAL